ncbi:hypothetical protein [Methylomonas sp. HYX-M1]|uniref:hypothetical protein n=1 Tax=Methylomonas sp. HYX-M1 TaxID=3139307 RepID=UPI00345BE40E
MIQLPSQQDKQWFFEFLNERLKALELKKTQEFQQEIDKASDDNAKRAWEKKLAEASKIAENLVIDALEDIKDAQSTNPRDAAKTQFKRYFKIKEIPSKPEKQTLEALMTVLDFSEHDWKVYKNKQNNENDFLQKVTDSLISDLEANKTLLAAMQTRFHSEINSTSESPTSIELTAHFTQACCTKNSLTTLIDSLRTVFKERLLAIAGDVTGSSAVQSLKNTADRLLGKLLLFTIREQWLEQKRGGITQEYSLPNLHPNTVKVVHSRLTHCVPNLAKQQSHQLPNAPNIDLGARITDFLIALAGIVDANMSLPDVPRGSEMSQDDREKLNNRLARQLDEAMEFMSQSSDIDFKEHFFWIIKDGTAGETEVIDWIKSHIKHLHWIILKSDASEEIFWFSDTYLERVITEYYKVWNAYA